MRRSLLGVAFIGMAMFLSACQNQPTPTSTPLPPPTANIIFVTRTPAPSALPSALPASMANLVGNWRLNLTYNLEGVLSQADVRYTGFGAVTVDGRGNITGSIALNGAATSASCTTAVLDSSPLNATISGTLNQIDTNAAGADLLLTPQNPAQVNSIKLTCMPSTGTPTVITYQQALVWPALTAVKGLTLPTQFVLGARSVYYRDLSGPTAGIFHGLVSVDYNLSR